MSSNTKKAGRYAVIHTTFLYSCIKTLFSIYRVMLLAICTTQVKKRVKRDFKKRKK